jgi:hypothetical protein
VSDRNGHTSTLDDALAYRRAGFSILPIRRDGTKAPDGRYLPSVPDEQGRPKATWEPLQEAPASEQDIRQWFRGSRPPGIGIIGGRVSGNLEQLDFDHAAAAIFPQWRELVEAERPGLVERLPVIRTPRKPVGYHVRYRCRQATIPGNMKLAEEPYTDPDTGRPALRVLVETRGEGGYALAPGSPPECHENHTPYVHHSGPPLTEVPEISAEEREVLVRCARSFDRTLGDYAGGDTGGVRGRGWEGLSPGDDYNRRGPDWADVLEPHGWACVRRRGEERFWKRPGKDAPGWSATTGRCSTEKRGDLLCVFSSNAHPFPGPAGEKKCSTHSKFAAYCLLNHRGDFKAAAKALYAEGYGDRREQRDGQQAGARGAAGPADAESRQDGPPPKGAAPRFEFISSAEFAAAEYRLEWLVERLLVKGQPAVVGGPKKALKTSLLVDLALSLGTGTPFLGEFAVPAPVSVALLSGESGQATLKDTAVRVAAAKGIDLARADVVWGFKLPQLADPTHLAALEEALRHHGVKVLMLDPLYLSLLAGVGTGGPQASNVYQMGPLLMAVSQTCEAAGCQPVLAHHFKLTRADHYAEPQLEDLAFSGIQEWVRQWALVGRREKYEVGSGRHQLWLSVGGSAGQSGLWALNVDEGTIDRDFRGRKWEVSLTTASAVRQEQESERAEGKRQKQAAQDQQDDAAVLAALDQLDREHRGASSNRVQDAASLSDARMLRAVLRLKAANVVQETTVVVTIGSGARRTVKGLVRCPEG